MRCDELDICEVAAGEAGYRHTSPQNTALLTMLHTTGMAALPTGSINSTSF